MRKQLLTLYVHAGIDEKYMESNLAKWFELAEIWGAVMLIDEADVYLEKRRTGELQRNSLVSGQGNNTIDHRAMLTLLQHSCDLWNTTVGFYS